MRNQYEVNIRIMNTKKGYETCVQVEHKETHKKGIKKGIFSSIPEDFEPMIQSAIEDCSL